MIDILRRLMTPLRDPVPGSRYPQADPLLQFATRGLPRIDPLLCDKNAACAAVCPTGAIELEMAGEPASAPKPVSLTPASLLDRTASLDRRTEALTGRRESAPAIRAGLAAPFIDAGRCVMCAACVTACPAGAIRMTSRTELARPTLAELIERPETQYEQDRATADRARARILAAHGRSLHVRHLDAGSCNGCDWEIAALLNPYHDVQRLGIDFVASPRHADLLLVTGVMTANLEEAARRTYEAMPEPRLVVAVGACAISGGVFAGSPVIRDGAAGVLPVDVFIPGCPPRPEAIIEGMLMALEGRRATGRATATGAATPPTA